MSHYLTAVLLVLMSALSAAAEECSVSRYGSLITEAKSADEGRLWGRSVELYRTITGECAPLIQQADLVRAYDALSVAEMMQANYPAAIAAADKCLELDNRCNACMMTAARSYENLGERETAVSFATAAVEVGGYDDYSTAVVILAKDFLKKTAKTAK